MSYAEAYSGSNGSWGSAFSLVNGSTTPAAITDDVVCGVTIDLSALNWADVYLLEGKEKCRSGDSQKTFFREYLRTSHGPVYKTPGYLLLHGWDWLLSCVDGTNSRTITYSLRTAAASGVITEHTSGSNSISTSVFSLFNNSTTPASITDDGCYQIWIDRANLTDTEEYEFTWLEKARSADTQRMFYHENIAYAASSWPLWTSVISPILLHGHDATLKRLAGSDRTIIHSIRRIN